MNKIPLIASWNLGHGSKSGVEPTYKYSDWLFDLLLLYWWVGIYISTPSLSRLSFQCMYTNILEQKFRHLYERQEYHNCSN